MPAHRTVKKDLKGHRSSPELATAAGRSDGHPIRTPLSPALQRDVDQLRTGVGGPAGDRADWASLALALTSKASTCSLTTWRAGWLPGWKAWRTRSRPGWRPGWREWQTGLCPGCLNSRLMSVSSRLTSGTSRPVRRPIGCGESTLLLPFVQSNISAAGMPRSIVSRGWEPFFSRWEPSNQYV